MAESMPGKASAAGFFESTGCTAWANGMLWASYESELSVAYKARWIQAANLRGGALTDLHADTCAHAASSSAMPPPAAAAAVLPLAHVHQPKTLQKELARAPAWSMVAAALLMSPPSRLCALTCIEAACEKPGATTESCRTRHGIQVQALHRHQACNCLCTLLARGSLREIGSGSQQVPEWPLGPC